jgi:hypothetical protein
MAKHNERHKNDIHCRLNLTADSQNSTYRLATIDIRQTGPDIELVIITRPTSHNTHSGGSNKFIHLEHYDALMLLSKLEKAIEEAQRFL